MNKLVSVIIPAYNAGRFIEKGIESVISQDYANIEVIVINDGSSDNTGEKLEQLSVKYQNIRYFTQENKGVSYARNLGIKFAKGDYILFMDADDSLSDGYLRNMIEIQKKNPEKLIMSRIKNVNLEGNVLREIPSSMRKVNILTKFDLFMSICEIQSWGGFPFNKLFIKKIIDDNNIKFDTTIHFGEDTLFCYQYCEYVKGGVGTDNYNLRLIHPNSMVNSRRSGEKFNTKWLTVIDEQKQLIEWTAKNLSIDEKQRVKVNEVIYNNFKHQIEHLLRAQKRLNYDGKEISEALLFIDEKKGLSYFNDLKCFILVKRTIKFTLQSLIVTRKLKKYVNNLKNTY